jgi:tRNA pseudouridine55 synthase
VEGVRAYDIARSGQTAELKPREIVISEFEITAVEMPDVSFRIVCSKGTYIRSIARDFGIFLKSGAHLTSLCRTRIGSFKLSEAVTPQQFSEKISGSV